ncbi:CLM5 protein, partial [Atractosteus spatula]|nr:CLM5 protein [Atractosteus spatula]
GAAITVQCQYDTRFQTDVKFWCRGYDVRSCEIIAQTNRSQLSKDKRISITDNNGLGLLSITINKLRKEDEGFYWCGIARDETSMKHRLQISVTAGKQQGQDKIKVIKRMLAFN